MNGNQELAGIGSANLAAGLFSGFPVSTSGSRTAVAAQSGAKTQLTGLVAAALVLADAPRSCRASSRRCRSRSSRRSSSRRRSACSTSPSCAACSRVRKTEFALAVACALGVAFVGVLQGIVIAVVLSVMYIFKRAWAPYSAVLGKGRRGSPATTTSRRYPDAEQVPGLLIVRWSAPLFFANANQFRDRIRELVKAADPTPPLGPRRRRADHRHRHDGRRDAGRPRPRAQRGGIHLAFAELQSGVRDMIERYGLFETIEEGHFYRSVTEAVDALRSEMSSRP